ncbi:hypothetical protein P9847_13675 [Paenibacillus chibensis]|uniref:Uncharacterized protein n=1 Tax=Paenibacillus chibensis TaxID=59846 RepID=A0ABU6PTY7_9BACL|nr:hypothetical protein [Paenibacillus chibensis]
MNSRRLLAKTLVGSGAVGALLYGYAALKYGVWDLLGILLFSVLPATYGFMLNKRDRKRASAHMEKEILKLAANRKNLLTTADVALCTSLNMEQSSEVLEDLRRKGYLRLKVADNGAFVYEFQSFLSMEEKLSAERV